MLVQQYAAAAAAATGVPGAAVAAVTVAYLVLLYTRGQEWRGGGAKKVIRKQQYRTWYAWPLLVTSHRCLFLLVVFFCAADTINASCMPHACLRSPPRSCSRSIAATFFFVARMKHSVRYHVTPRVKSQEREHIARRS